VPPRYVGAARCTSSRCTSGALQHSAPQVHFILVHLRCTSGVHQVCIRSASVRFRCASCHSGAARCTSSWCTSGAPQVRLSAPQCTSCAPQVHLGVLHAGTSAAWCTSPRCTSGAFTLGFCSGSLLEVTIDIRGFRNEVALPAFGHDCSPCHCLCLGLILRSLLLDLVLPIC
jgi:hypothetical protein